MPTESFIIASGNLATARRTVMGVLSQLVVLGISDSTALQIVTDAGLPARALAEPDFPISLDQELLICVALARQLGGRSPVRALFELRQRMGIENLGVLGLAMQHAATTVEALKICVTYPQLSGGHCRMVVRRQPDATTFSFSMQRPLIRDASAQDIDRLVEYCTVLDMLSSMRNIKDIVASDQPPRYISLPFPEPLDWAEVCDDLPCPVYFSQKEASLAFPAAFDALPPPRANPLMYRFYVAIARKMSLMLAEDIGISERVTRWLWAYTPPCDEVTSPGNWLWQRAASPAPWQLKLCPPPSRCPAYR